MGGEGAWGKRFDVGVARAGGEALLHMQGYKVTQQTL